MRLHPLSVSYFRTFFGAGLLAVVIVGPSHKNTAAASTPSPEKAEASIRPASGSDVHGKLRIEKANDSLHITGEISNLSPGPHGFHIHENGVCDEKDASSAGGHFNPDTSAHGSPTDEKTHRHAGDLGNIIADKDGTAKVDIKDKVLSLSGSNSILNRSFVIHQSADDLKTQPSGNSGARIGCGVVQPVDHKAAEKEGKEK